MSEYFTQFDSVFFEKTRLSILAMLYRSERASFKQIKDALGLSDGALYTHIEKLVKAGYVDKARDIVGVSPQTVYVLSDQGQVRFEEYLQFVSGLVREQSNVAGGGE